MSVAGDDSTVWTLFKCFPLTPLGMSAQDKAHATLVGPSLMLVLAMNVHESHDSHSYMFAKQR